MSQGLCLGVRRLAGGGSRTARKSYRVLIVDEDDAAIATLRSEWIERACTDLLVREVARIHAGSVLPGDWANLIVSTNTSREMQQ